MTQSLTIPAGERGQVRVFALAMDDDAARALVKQHGETTDDRDAALTALFGVADLDTNYIDVLDLSALQEVGLIAYLTDGTDVDPADLAEDRTRLEGVRGWVVVVLSAAFKGNGQVIPGDPRLALIGTYSQRGIDWSSVPIETTSAAPPLAKPQKTDARVGGMVAMAVLLFLAVLVTALVLLSG
jgi:hypothetical protein